MRTATSAAAVLAAVVTACGGGSLPGGDDVEGTPVLAPLATGTRWTYRVEDPVAGSFEKHVEVVGPAAVPESTATAILVRDVEPTNEERAWVAVENGFLVREREEDRKAGQLVRATTWAPAAPKILAAPAEKGFTARITVTEREWHADGTVSVKQPIYEFRVVATGVPVAVPAGTFTCVQVERQRLDKAEAKRTYWLAPGVGKIREEGERVEELVRHEPGR